MIETICGHCKKLTTFMARSVFGNIWLCKPCSFAEPPEGYREDKPRRV